MRARLGLALAAAFGLVSPSLAEEGAKPAPARPAGAQPSAAPSPEKSTATPAPAAGAASPAPATGAAKPAPPRGALPPGGRRVPRPYPPPYPGYVYPAWAYDPAFYWWAAPFWWGWGWGWGYYPMYPSPDQPPPDEQMQRLVTRFAARGGGRHDGAYGGVELAIEGRRLGFHASVDGLSVKDGAYATAYGTTSTLTHAYATTHLTALLASGRSGRLRVELGGSMLSYSDNGPDAGVAAFGPDFGLSGNLGLVGPLGVEGAFHYTPFPVPITDAMAGLIFHFGPAGLSVVWRDFYAYKNSYASAFRVRGPGAQLAFLF